MKGLIAELETMESPKRALNMDKKALNIWNVDKRALSMWNIESHKRALNIEH